MGISNEMAGKGGLRMARRSFFGEAGFALREETVSKQEFGMFHHFNETLNVRFGCVRAVRCAVVVTPLSRCGSDHTAA